MENKDRKSTQPEFTPDYIDQLFSGTNSKPEPEKPSEPAPPAEKKAQIFTAAKAAAMQEPAEEEYEPEPKKSWRKPLLILAAAAVLIPVLFMNISNAIANEKPMPKQTNGRPAARRLMWNCWPGRHITTHGRSPAGQR